MKENSKDNDCSCVGQGASEQGGITTALPGAAQDTAADTKPGPGSSRPGEGESCSKECLLMGWSREHTKNQGNTLLSISASTLFAP